MSTKRKKPNHPDFMLENDDVIKKEREQTSWDDLGWQIEFQMPFQGGDYMLHVSPHLKLWRYCES